MNGCPIGKDDNCMWTEQCSNMIDSDEAEDKTEEEYKRLFEEEHCIKDVGKNGGREHCCRC